ncbi:hypothetical protein GH714_010135 [Hevea brasiliensis]|uniref:Uncharacterized protein n=1 Tax=Hevea brasiliensis TaxID=3981 RepID=A0A6A6KQF0_HEVBR|nr:hypothetical protein GH714_010135 [Hevea brasiliensis]
MKWQKRVSCPRRNFNSSGIIDKRSLCAKGWSKPVSELQVTVEAHEEIYQAAFLNYGLYKFVLSYKEVDLIRPSTFKVASMMAIGRRSYLAVPILASIYNGLREISTSSDLSTCLATSPVHFVYGWGVASITKEYLNWWSTKWTKAFPKDPKIALKLLYLVQQMSSKAITNTPQVDNSKGVLNDLDLKVEARPKQVLALYSILLPFT